MSNEPDSAAKVEREIQEIANRRGAERRARLREAFFEKYRYDPTPQMLDLICQAEEAKMRMEQSSAEALQRELEAVTRRSFQASIYNNLNFGTPITFPPYPIDTGTLLPPMPDAPVPQSQPKRRDPSKLHGVDVDLEGEAPGDGAVKPTKKVEIDL